tara:strand:- start:640 stop:750 length:111 start_codon:yes stop_codon:yes gene_type:complete
MTSPRGIVEIQSLREETGEQHVAIPEERETGLAEIG